MENYKFEASINNYSSSSNCVSENFNHSLEHVNMHDPPSDSTISPITYTHAQSATYPDYNLPARYVGYNSLNDVPTHSSNVLPTFNHSPVTAYSHSTGQSLHNYFQPMENFQNSTLTGDTLCSPFTTYRRGTSYVLQHSISVTSVDSPLSSPSSFESIASSPEADLNAYPLSTCDHSSTEDKIYEDISQIRFLPTTSVDSIGVKKEEGAEPVCAQIPIDFVTAQFTRGLCDPGDCTVSRSRPKSESKKSKRRQKRNNSVNSKDEKICKGKTIQLWEFLYKTLRNPEYNPSYIRWENESKGSFRFVKSDAVAKLWGYTKFNPFMTYEKLSRAMRHYYKRGIIKRLDDRRLVYRFTPHSLELLSAIYPSTALSLTVP